MNLGSLKPPKGATRSRKRLGAGPGSGTGKTSGRGHKGQKARGSVRASFEGGQMPLQMRLPKVGFAPQRPANQVVNLSDLSRKNIQGEVTPEVLKAAGLIRSVHQPIKVLGEGEVAGALSLQGVSVSIPAARKIEAAGGSVAAARLAVLPENRKKKGRKRRGAGRTQAGPKAADAPAEKSE